MNFGYSILMIMCYTKQVWRRTEVAVTGLTRNQFTGLTPVRGFESLRLRLFDNDSFDITDIKTIVFYFYCMSVNFFPENHIIL